VRGISIGWPTIDSKFPIPRMAQCDNLVESSDGENRGSSLGCRKETEANPAMGAKPEMRTAPPRDGGIELRSASPVRLVAPRRLQVSVSPLFLGSQTQPDGPARSSAKFCSIFARPANLFHHKDPGQYSLHGNGRAVFSTTKTSSKRCGPAGRRSLIFLSHA